MFGFVKTTMIELFDECYIAITEDTTDAAIAYVATVGLQMRGMIQYRDFNNMRPPEFDGVKDPIATMRCISYVEVYLFTRVPRGPEGQVHFEPSLFGGEGLVKAGDQCLLSYIEGHSDLGEAY